MKLAGTVRHALALRPPTHTPPPLRPQQSGNPADNQRVSNYPDFSSLIETYNMLGFRKLYLISHFEAPQPASTVRRGVRQGPPAQLAAPFRPSAHLNFDGCLILRPPCPPVRSKLWSWARPLMAP